MPVEKDSDGQIFQEKRIKINRYKILISKDKQFKCLLCYDEGCQWCGIRTMPPLSEYDEEPIEIPVIERSESEWKTAEIKSTAFAVNIDFSQISGLRKPSTKELDSLRQNMRTRQQRAMMSAFGVTSQS